MKYYILSGEASGDLHAGNLAKEIYATDPQAQIRAWGGNRLRKAGAEVVKDYKDLAFMGFVEVALNLRTILKNMTFCQKDILSFAPDVVILVDYPGFNLRISKFLKKKNIKTFYYISPQIWAWHQSRIKIIKKNIDAMFVILPFEKDFFAKNGMTVDYHGHPLLDEIKNSRIESDFRQKNELSDQKIIAILPGSRKQEILRMLPTMIAVAKQYNNYQFVIAGVENQRQLYADIVKDFKITIVYNNTYNLLSQAHAAMVTSGTATLETALFNVPQVVCYKANYFSYLIAKRLVKGIRYISLVNLVADKQIVTELIQKDMTIERLKTELDMIVAEGKNRIDMLNNYSQLHHQLGEGSACKQIAKAMLEKLS